MRFTMRKVPFAVLMFLHFSATLSSLCSPAGAAGSVEVLSSTGYLDSSGNYRVVGEVQNVGSQAVNFVEVTATFYDSHNVVVDSRFDLTMLYVILVGRKSPFELALLDVAESAIVSRYSLSVTYLETTELPMKLEILSQSNYTDAEGNMHLAGTLRNLGNEKLVNAKVVATYYDALSQVVATASIGFDPDLTGDIDPYQTVEFEIVLDKSRAQYVQAYALVAESNQYAMVPEVPTIVVFLIISLVSAFACRISKSVRNI
jgi:hypothetical protein